LFLSRFYSDTKKYLHNVKYIPDIDGSIILNRATKHKQIKINHKPLYTSYTMYVRDKDIKRFRQFDKRFMELL